MMEEYEIAKSMNLFIIPVGCTGYAAKDIWSKELAIIDSQKDTSDKYKELFLALGDDSKTPNQIIDIVLNILSFSSKDFKY